MNQFTNQLAIIEHDINDDVLVVFTYPGLSSSLQTICVKRAAVEGIASSFIYFKVKNDWIYILTHSVSDSISRDVTHASIVLVTNLFNPERFNAQLDLMYKGYIETLDPTKSLEVYLRICVSGKYESYQDASYVSCTDISVIKELFDMLGQEFIIVWNAVLLKKRIILISDSSLKLLPAVRSLPLLCMHRKDYSVLRPIVRNDPESIEDLKSTPVYIAGTLDTSLANRTEIYDVLINLNEHRVLVANHAIEEMRMSAAHKEMASLIAAAAVTGSSDDLALTISKKTEQIITQLKSLGVPLTEDLLRSQVTNEVSQQWLLRLALSEGLI